MVRDLHTLAVLASERYPALGAEATGRTTVARSNRPPAPGTTVVLRDGSKVLIRPVRSDDAPLLADGFARLSPRSRRLRFLAGKKELSRAELRYLTEVDHHDHVALAALDQTDGRGVGIARYVRDTHEPRSAEVAAVVIDDWQHRGLGTELLTRLAHRALQEGICRFTGLVAADNVAVTGLIRKFGATAGRREFSTVEYEIALTCPENPRAAGESEGIVRAGAVSTRARTHSTEVHR